MANIHRPVAPNLPLAPTEYASRYFDHLTNTLRLYFNQLDGYNKAISPAVGNFQARTTQTLTGSNTATQITFDTALESSSVNIDTATNRVSVMQSGQYMFSFDVPPAAGVTRYIWLRLNGADVV